MNEITIIQGDTYEAELEINGLTSTDIVKKCVFASSYFNICKELSVTAQKTYLLTLTPEDTSGMREGVSDFDITVYFTDQNVATVIYCGQIKVLAKKNKCNG